MKITIAKINRQLREGTSPKTGKPYSFESLGIAPKEDTLTDINGIDFARDSRWLNGSSVPGVTDNWAEGDVVLINLIQKEVTGRDGSQKKVINFKLPEGVEPMVKKFVSSPEPEAGDEPDF